MLSVKDFDKDKIYYDTVLIGRDFKEKGNWEIAEKYFKKAIEINPVRLEAFYELGSYFRKKEDYTISYEFLRNTREFEIPDTPFYDREVYDFKALDELSISSYYVDEFKLSFEICNDLLSNFSKLPNQGKERVKRNRAFAMERLYEEKMQLEIVEISTIAKCTVRCPYCPQDKLVESYDKNKFLMTFEDFKTIADKIYPVCRFIDFSGFVEPFLNKACFDMILYASRKGFNIRIFSTLEGIFLEDIKRLKDVNFDHFCIHVPTESMKIDINRRYIETFLWVIQNFEHSYWLLDGPAHPRLISDIPDLKNICENAKVSRANNIGDDFMYFLKSQYEVGNRLYCLRESYNHPVIIPDGTAALCCQDYGLRHRMGNILHDSLDEFMDSLEYKRIRKGLNGRLKNEILCNICEYAYPY